MRRLGLAAAAAATGLDCSATVCGRARASQLALGQPGVIGPVRAPVAAAACHASTGLQGTSVSVMLADMGPGMMRGQPRMGSCGGPSMMQGRWLMMRLDRQTVKAGKVSLVADNHGDRAHELVVPLSDGAFVGSPGRSRSDGR